VYAGYHWLRLIPSGAPRPTAIVLTVAVVPATYALTRHLSGRATGRVRSVARSCAVLLPALWIVLLVVHRGVVADVLGVVSLALALSSVALAVLAETGEHRRTGPTDRHRRLAAPDQPPVDRVAPALYRQTG